LPLQFTPRVFFLSVPNELLKSYFARRGELLDFPWERFALSDSDPLYEEWRALPEQQRDQTEAELRAVADIGTTDGLRLVAEEARARGIDLAPILRTLDGPWAQALRIFLEHRELFDIAGRFDRADQLNGRYWRKRADLTRKEPDVSPVSCAALGTSIAAYFQPAEKGAARCHVRWDIRGGRRHYFIAYPLAAAELVDRYDARGEIVQVTLGDVLLIVPSYYVIKDGIDVTIAASEHVLFDQNKTVEGGRGKGYGKHK